MPWNRGQLFTAPQNPAQTWRGGGGHVRLTTKRGSIVVMARADRAVAEDMVFLPFAYVEAAANILTNPAVDPYGKSWFKFSAVKVEKADLGGIAAE